MLFEDVLPAFRQGHKIRSKRWAQGFYIDLEMLSIDDNFILFSSLLTPIDILDDEWEILLYKTDYHAIVKQERRNVKNE